jgi:hypothetical protein
MTRNFFAVRTRSGPYIEMFDRFLFFLRAGTASTTQRLAEVRAVPAPVST